MSRPEARRAIGLPGRADTDPMLQPVNVETVDQAQQRQDRADAAQEATATAANSNIAASLTRALDRMRPLAVDVAGRQLETTGIVARLESGRRSSSILPTSGKPSPPNSRPSRPWRRPNEPEQDNLRAHAAYLETVAAKLRRQADLLELLAAVVS